MNIVIIGPGAMGCLFAGLLVEGGHAVHLLDKRRDRALRIARQGLIIEEGRGARTIPIRATAEAESLKHTDLVVICVKAHDTATTLPELSVLTAGQTRVLTLQNGLGNVEQLAACVAPDRVFAGVTAHGSTLLGIGHVRHAGAGRTRLAALRPEGRTAATELAQLLTRAGIRSDTAPDLAPVLWGKLIVNAAIGPVAALSGLPNGQLPEREPWRGLLEQAATEGAAVAARKGIRLPYNDPVGAVFDVCRNTAENFSSMLQDVRRHRKTEIDAINGAIVREAAALAVPTPVHEGLVRQIQALSVPTPPSSRTDLRDSGSRAFPTGGG